jgi:hypothetical protein
MSIPLVQKAEKDDINTSIIAIKRNIERINMLLGLVDSGSPDLSGLATKQELEDAITQVETDLAPVDEVTSGNMHSVTSGAVYSALLLLKTVSRGGTLLSGNTQLTGDGLSYTITKKGIVKVNFCKVGQGYSLYLSRNDTEQDRFSFYQGNSNYNFGSLSCFVDVGDTIKIYSDGSYTNFYIQTIILQELGIR